MSEPLLNQDIVAELGAVMGKAFAVLCDKFALDVDQRQALLKEALDNRQAEQLKQQAHSMKGACANMGASSLASLCEQIQQLAPDQHWEQLEGLLAALSDLSPKVVGALREKAPDQNQDG